MGRKAKSQIRQKWPGTRCVKDRNGEPKYWYVRPLGDGAEIRIAADYGTQDWERQYLAARGGKMPVRRLSRKAGTYAKMTFAEGAERYLRSTTFLNLARETQYKRKLDIEERVRHCGDCLLADLTQDRLMESLADLT